MKCRFGATGSMSQLSMLLSGHRRLARPLAMATSGGLHTYGLVSSCCGGSVPREGRGAVTEGSS